LVIHVVYFRHTVTCYRLIH